jgi:hypothetical protein
MADEVSKTRVLLEQITDEDYDGKYGMDWLKAASTCNR